ncbi:DUF2157 domain-containing protein [Pontibacter qinzhouensis]|uniref:DUF2157 domain-containing protein n=1 Tax=Pontibacter qinzhouensis TaxID=2603253 RepID=A0A5C8IT24_9BACT|nr:DUF2157 domain-containing protein [Pontibacter qinzhouensis]TXK24678.1 DUF2157 domain-containing protein [Pontibacter qinzhouensis]
MTKDLPELVQAGVITPQTADDIRAYYAAKAVQAPNRLLLVSGILGALLIGLGIILIIAHNWDDLSRSVKTMLVFLPLLISQGLAGYTLFKKRTSSAWRESTATLLFFSVGATMALVSQVYHIPGNLSSFLLTWMLLCLPLVYLLSSSFASLLYLAGITLFALESGFGSYDSNLAYGYWPLLLLLVPYYRQLFLLRPNSNVAVFHHWLLPLSLLLGLTTLLHATQEVLFIAYMSLLGIFSLVGNTGTLKDLPLRSNGYLFLGYLGSAGVLLAFTFKLLWVNVSRFEIVFLAPELIAAILLTGAAVALLLYKWQKRQGLHPMEYVFLFFILFFALAHVSVIAATILTNILVLAIGLYTIRAGARKDSLGLLNLGLLFITALILLRFFDSNLSFVMRGLLFVLVGTGFFFANFFMLKKRNTYEA